MQSMHPTLDQFLAPHHPPKYHWGGPGSPWYYRSLEFNPVAHLAQNHLEWPLGPLSTAWEPSSHKKDTMWNEKNLLDMDFEMFWNEYFYREKNEQFLENPDVQF